MRLLFALLLSLIGISFCIDCQHSALSSSTVTVSSTLSQNYGKEKIENLSDDPWVGASFSRSSNWVSVDFPKPIILTRIQMTGGSVDVYGNGTVKCYVERFWLDYNNKTKSGIRFIPKFRDNTGNHDADVDIKEPITSINITIIIYTGCPAVNLKLLACGDCPSLSNKDKQILKCTTEQACTYSCEDGYKSRDGKSGVKMCQLNGIWSGPDLTCVDKDECTNPTICGDNATCENTDGSYRCPCESGYAKQRGSNVCTDVDECKDSSKCNSPRVTCNNNQGSYSCQCKDGYTGDGVICIDVDECNDSSKCHSSLATCTNNPGSYSCQCLDGYTGDGVTCNDVDECKDSSKCHSSLATCINRPGSYSCQCLDGYTGDGVTCNDVDECKDFSKCHSSLATCTNRPGSYSCQCLDGYTGDGVTCNDIDECEKNSCHKYANCTNTQGSFDCTCKKGYKQIGMECKGDEVQISNMSLKRIKVRYGEKLQLYCQAEGLPEPTVIWKAPRKNMTRISNVTLEGSVKSTLVVNSVTLGDNGTYNCIASNIDTHDEVEFSVTVDGKPISPKITNREAGANFIRATWNKPSDEGAGRINGYRVCYMPPEKTIILKATQLSIKIDNLTPNTAYTINVEAFNDEGASMRSSFHLNTLAPKPVTVAPPQIKEGGSSTTSVTIQVKKIDSEYNITLQVIVEKLPQRRKRAVSDFPKTIHDYENSQKYCSQTSNCFYIAAEQENKDNEFVVGDDKMYGKYRNPGLEPGTAYKIYTRGISYNDANPKVANIGEPSQPLRIRTAAIANNESEGGGSIVAIAVGLTVFLVVVVVLVFLAILYIRSRRPKIVEIDPETGEKKARRGKINSELLPLTRKGHAKRKSAQVEDGSPDPNHPPVPTSGFAKYVGKLHKSDDRGFMIQYNTLDTSQTYTSEFATSPENKEKNRYANIVAYDVSRVHLKQIDDDDNSTYINASFIDGYNSPNAYIATQGPLPATFNDFWRMIWERNCSSIVMLTNLQERHKLKCNKYWPEESEAYGDITVTATRREQYADYVIRTFLLKMNETEEEREIKQFHFTVWPDHGVPEYPTAILAFQRRVRAYSTRDSGPLAVHCSAGVGRSGTFIVIDCMLAQIQQEQTVDIYNCVRYLRTRRMFMVQTEEQYVFCHDALLESILCGNTEMAAHNLRIEMNRLRQNNATTKMTGYESEFKTLNKVSPSLPKESFVVATYEENICKNRYHDILASDHGRVILGDSEDKPDDGPYINAVFVDGYKQQHAFILTQVPLKTTINDFWRMSYEKHSACVVLLSDLAEEEGEFPQFWPDDGTEAYDTLNVELVADAPKGDAESVDQFQQISLSDDIVERKFKLSKEEEKPLTVKMFQHLSWKETSVPSDISGIISLIQSIEKWQQHSGNGPITVICNDGQGRSGTFAAFCSVLERVKTEQVVDVFQAIKALRIQRPGLVKNVGQYQFIHLGVQEYLDSFSDYANFK